MIIHIYQMSLNKSLNLYSNKSLKCYLNKSLDYDLDLSNYQI